MSTIVINNPGPNPLKAFVHGAPSGPGYSGIAPSDGDEATSMVAEYVISPGATESIPVPPGAHLVVRELGLGEPFDPGPSDGG